MKKFLLILLSYSLAFSTRAQEGMSDEAKAQMMAEMMGNMMNAEVSAAYSFPIRIDMRMTSYGKKSEVADVSMYVNAKEKTFAMKPDTKQMNNKNTLVIFDNTRNTMAMLDMDQKTGIAMSFDNPLMKMALDANNRNGYNKDNYDCKNTGKTKDIQGYNATQTVCTDDKGNRMDIWVTKQIPVELNMPNSNAMWASFLQLSEGMGGMLMQADIYENDKPTGKMEVTEINKNANFSVKTTDYKMGMEGMR